MKTKSNAAQDTINIAENERQGQGQQNKKEVKGQDQRENDQWKRRRFNIRITGVDKEENQYSVTKRIFKGMIQGRFSEDEKI